MYFFSIFIVFLIVWWLVLFTVLPFGCSETSNEKGHASSAPKKPQLIKKFIITTIISIIITTVYFVAKYYGYLDFVNLRPN